MNLDGLKKYLPDGAFPFVEGWLEKESIRIKIKPSRKTKLGDYRFLRPENKHQITIDNSLPPEAFFFVLTHEIAHLFVYNHHKGSALPHGNEWKMMFGKMLNQSLSVYSEEVRPYIRNHSIRPKASVGADRNLHRKMFLKEENLDKLVESLTLGQKFLIGKRIFEKGKKRKTRYLCKELSGQKLYLVSGQAVVDKIIEE